MGNQAATTKKGGVVSTVSHQILKSGSYNIVAGPPVGILQVVRSIAGYPFSIVLPSGKEMKFQCDLIQIRRGVDVGNGLHWVNFEGTLFGTEQGISGEYNPITHVGILKVL